jgi:hypothetical protein
MFLITPLITNRDPLKSLLFSDFLTTMTALEEASDNYRRPQSLHDFTCRNSPTALLSHLKMIFWGPNGKYLVGRKLQI